MERAAMHRTAARPAEYNRCGCTPAEVSFSQHIGNLIESAAMKSMN